MGANTKIEWCDKTFNPWWGCTKASSACDHCYAESFAKRTGNGVWGKDAPRRFFGDAHWNEPLKWNRLAAASGIRYRVFCASMADVMEEYNGAEHLVRETMDESRRWLYSLIERTPNLDWLLLTKRPQNFRRLLPAAWIESPRPNVWLMATVESNEFLWRVEALLEVPAVIHGVSYEPAIGPVGLLAYMPSPGAYRTLNGRVSPNLDWVIAGGESGGGARGSNPDWFRAVRDDCASTSTAFLFKQWGEFHPMTRTDGIHESPFGGHQLIRIGKKEAGRLLDGREHNEFPVVGVQ